MSSNYLVDFLYKVDCLISELNKLNSKIRMYQKNSKTFGIDFDVKFKITPNYFLKLRDFLQYKIDEGSIYDRNIVNMKRDFYKEFSYIILKIEREITRIEDVQEKAMNDIVYKEIYYAKFDNEIKLMNEYNTSSTIFDAFIGKAKYKKLSFENHRLKSEIIKKEYNQKNFERKNIFELVNLIENATIKNGSMLCLQDDMIKAFMVDRHSIKRNNEGTWKQVQLIPSGIFEKKAHFKVLNKNLINENKELEMKLKDIRFEIVKEKNLSRDNLKRLNTKLTKILQGRLAESQERKLERNIWK